MAWRPHGKAIVNARQPRALAVCERCSFLTNHYKLRWQYDWAGLRMQNLRILVCDECYDEPQRQKGAKPATADPLAIPNARPEPFTVTGFGYDESNVMEQPMIYAPPFGSPPRKPWSVSGPQMLMPDDATVMLMPDNPTGT